MNTKRQAPPPGKRWEPFDVWIRRYERATDRDDFRPRIPGAPRGY